MISYKLTDERLFAPSSAVVPVDLPSAVRRVLAFDKILVVCVAPQGPSQNVYGVGPDGRLNWQVNDETTVGGLFYDIMFAEHGKVYAFYSMGFRFTLDPYTGRVIECLLVK